MIYPCSVPNFLTKQEMLDIKDRIFSLKRHWLTVKGEYDRYNIVDNKSFTLGHAAYVLNSPDNPLVENIDNSILFERFGEIHDKTAYLLQKRLGIKKILPFYDFTLPGFHIFRGPRKEAFSNLHYHADGSIFNFYPKSEDYYETTYSFSSIIYSDSKAHLEYKYNNEVKSFEYKEGHLNIWSAFLLHKIGTCDLEDNQHRITYQGHIFKYKDKHYMYF